MKSKDLSANDILSGSLPVVDVESNLHAGGKAHPKCGNNFKGPSSQWTVLLGELIHLLGLFWVHSRSAKRARATDVLFSQLLRYLHVLEKMPGHDGAILVRRVHCRVDAMNSVPDYIVLFGDVMINSKDEIAPQPFMHMKNALSRSFECFTEQNIHSLYLRIPGRSMEQIENFRFSMNILPRYYIADKDGISIAFRYYGRTLTIPLINDCDDRPNPNLTLMAALNGLTAINARELIRQAHAYQKIRLSESKHSVNPQPCFNCYDQIFKVRSLRSQIIKPPVEINNLFCPFRACAINEAQLCRPDDAKVMVNNYQPCTDAGALAGAVENAESKTLDNDKPLGAELAIGRHDLSGYVNSDDPPMSVALDALFADDYASLEPMALGERFVSITGLLYAIDRECQDPKVIERILEFLQSRLKAVSDKVLANIITQRQGLKIISSGRTVLVGLVHPRLFDLITLIKEHVIAYQRIDLIKEIAFNVDPCHINSLADGFGITSVEANHIIGLLSGCFVANGSFVRPTFESRVNAMTRHENVIFEILWCFLKQTPQRKDRLDFLNAIQLLMARMNDPKRALQFLLADICQNPSAIDYTDRNAFALANVLLHRENKELYIDVNRTPENVLKIQRPLNQKVRHYARWRLEVDQVRYLTKSRTVSNWIKRVLMTPSGEDPGPFELRFLLALERELLMFSSLVDGHAARIVLRRALSEYGDPDTEIYRRELTRQHFSQLIPHLQIVVRALGRAGNHEDIERLRTLVQNANALIDMDSHPAHGLRVKQMVKWVPEALKMIHAHNSRP